MSNSKNHPESTPHDPIKEVLPDFFYVHGSVRMGPMQISRNMVVIREEGALTLINAVRLSAEGERALEKLGTVKHVMRISSEHQMDDAYYVEKYNAAYWYSEAPEGHTGLKANNVLEENGKLPFKNAELIQFKSRLTEYALLLKLHGGILVTCDSIQHWVDYSNCNVLAKVALPLMGFTRKTLVGHIWKKAHTPEGGSLKPDFDRVIAWDFKHALGAHGNFIKDTAHERVEKAVARSFGK